MEHITPQYKRGKYIRRRNRGKRIAIICLCAAIVLSAAALLFFFRDRIFHPDAPTPTEASRITQGSDAPSDAAATTEPTRETEPEATIGGSSVALADGRLLLTYDSDALTLTGDDRLTTLLSSADDTPRMDIQKLPGRLGMLRDSELERVAIGLMQAYYYHPQKTEDVDLTVILNTKAEFSAAMQIPAIDDAPAAVCSVRLLAVGDELWAAVLLQPDGAESAALSNAFQWLTTTEENGN